MTVQFSKHDITTNLSQNTATGVITYTNEISTDQTANVVSTNAGNAIAIGTDGGAYLNIYEKIVIWAECDKLDDNSLEWSFGSGQNGRIGIPLPEDWEIYAVSFNANSNGAGDSAQMAVINSATNTNLLTFTATGNANNMVYTQMLTTVVPVTPGTSIGFRTINESGDIRGARVAVFLRRRP